jgi:hypothetical protein
MTIEIKTGIRYEYECPETKYKYIEQRNLGEPQFVTKSPAGFDYVLINQTEFTYEQEIPDIVVEEIIEEPTE